MIDGAALSVVTVNLLMLRRRKFRFLIASLRDFLIRRKAIERNLELRSNANVFDCWTRLITRPLQLEQAPHVNVMQCNAMSKELRQIIHNQCLCVGKRHRYGTSCDEPPTSCVPK